MIKFFRRIRQRLLTENKVGKYLFYAIGEIVLVVIGIFIAIQLNGWNQNRIEKKQLAETILNLENEFNRTKQLLSTISSGYRSSIDANIALLELFSKDHTSFSAKKVDTLLGRSGDQAPFYPLQPVLDELFNSGKIKSLPNGNLKQFLFDWEATIKWFHFDYELLLSFGNDQYQPYINRHWSWKNIDIAQGSDLIEKESSFNISNKELFQELEFENLIDSHLFQTNRLYKRLEAIDQLLDSILMEIEVSLQE